mmetsp:Transcript_20834/g.41424  ORF Transcript_20834/g.41424 Transcript_20834/m.41424 type:complete len:773 (+) Transcript_20834:141-2459(+)
MASSAAYTPANTTDEEAPSSSSSRRGKKKSTVKKNNNIPPPTSYRDDPSNSYRDNVEVPSVFDWGDSSSSSGAALSSAGGHGHKKSDNNHNSSTSFDPDVEIPFTPISLHDEEEDDDSEVSGSMALRPHNGLLSKVVSRRGGGHEYNPIGIGGGDDDEEQEGRLFVGGGWGRHGSSMDWCSCQRRFCCSRGGNSGGSMLCSSTGCFLVIFLALTFLCGYLGYEAGLPVTLDTTINDTATSLPLEDGTDGFATTHTITHGDLWLEWIKKEKDEHLHLPHLHLNFTKRHAPIIFTDDNNQLQRSFPPMTQADLLEHSENLFQSCSERSIATQVGREACLSLCHGHYCCFEKDVEFGSCVATPNSYCFVYAACENVIMDFGFTNINLEDGSTKVKNEGGSVDVDGLNREDLELLDASCSKENVATLDGIRDCNAFCQHHLCCFSSDEGENCQGDHVEECEAYESCRIIAEGPEGEESGGGSGGSGSNVSGGGGSITVTPNQVEKAVFDACYFGNDESKVTPRLVSECHSICSSRYCCFESQTMFSNCRGTVGDDECELYSLCEQMINERGEEVKNFIELDEKEFDTGDSSSSNNGVDSGTSYRPGSNGGFIDESEFEATVNEVKAACAHDESVGDSWVAGCHAMCADYLCCFSTDGTGSNCKDVHGDDVCEAYSGCKVLYSSSSASKLTFDSQQPQQQQQQQQQQQMSAQDKEQVQIDEMTETCVPKIRRDVDLRERCRNVCASRDCCWKDGPGNCYQMNTDWCEEFSLCEILVV